MIKDAILEGKCKSVKLPDKKKEYSGGYVLEPKVGLYQTLPVYVLDVKSLYPSVMIAYNISFDTINCACCKDEQGAYLTREVMHMMSIIGSNCPFVYVNSQ